MLSVEDSLASSKTKHFCAVALRFFGFGIGVMNFAHASRLDRRMRGMTGFVQCPISRGVHGTEVEDRVVEEGLEFGG